MVQEYIPSTKIISITKNNTKNNTKIIIPKTIISRPVFQLTIFSQHIILKYHSIEIFP
jgi:hypothetical protein